MFQYEKNALKRSYAAAAKVIGAISNCIASQITDPAVRRALILGCAAYFLRKAPFLDQSAAESLSDKLLVVSGLFLSKLPGSLELSKGKAVPASPEAAPAIVAPAAQDSAPAATNEGGAR